MRELDSKRVLSVEDRKAGGVDVVETPLPEISFQDEARDRPVTQT